MVPGQNPHCVLMNSVVTS